MIKMKMAGTEHSVVLLGLSRENINRLVAGDPILVELEDLGMGKDKILITFGETERVIMQELEDHGIAEPGTTAAMPDPQPGQAFRAGRHA